MSGHMFYEGQFFTKLKIYTRAATGMYLLIYPFITVIHSPSNCVLNTIKAKNSMLYLLLSVWINSRHNYSLNLINKDD